MKLRTSTVKKKYIHCEVVDMSRPNSVDRRNTEKKDIE